MCFRDLLLVLTLHVLNSIAYEVISHSSLIFPHPPLLLSPPFFPFLKRLLWNVCRLLTLFNYLRLTCESPLLNWATFPLSFSEFLSQVSSSSWSDFACSCSYSSKVTGICHNSFLFLNSLNGIVGGHKIPSTVWKCYKSNSAIKIFRLNMVYWPYSSRKWQCGLLIIR